MNNYWELMQRQSAPTTNSTTPSDGYKPPSVDYQDHSKEDDFYKAASGTFSFQPKNLVGWSNQSFEKQLGPMIADKVGIGRDSGAGQVVSGLISPWNFISMAQGKGVAKSLNAPTVGDIGGYQEENPYISQIQRMRG